MHASCSWLALITAHIVMDSIAASHHSHARHSPNREGESESWDFGVGAGFYLNATQPKWKNWRMYDYITKELPGALKALKAPLDVDNVRSPLVA